MDAADQALGEERFALGQGGGIELVDVEAVGLQLLDVVQPFGEAPLVAERLDPTDLAQEVAGAGRCHDVFVFGKTALDERPRPRDRACDGLG